MNAIFFSESTVLVEKKGCFSLVVGLKFSHFLSWPLCAHMKQHVGLTTAAVDCRALSSGLFNCAYARVRAY